MQTIYTKQTKSKKVYQSPKIQQVNLDVEISLVMMSSNEPPVDPTLFDPSLIPTTVNKIFKFGW